VVVEAKKEEQATWY